MIRGLALAALALCAAGALAGVPAAAGTTLPGFRSPSGNISCLLVPGARWPGGTRGAATLLCAIARSDYGRRLQDRCIRPPTELDWHGFELDAARKGRVVCSGGILYDPDTERPVYTTLPYGRTWRHASFTCASSRAGVTCRNRSGHGLFVSRQSWRAW